MNKIEIKKPSGKVYYELTYDKTNNWLYANWIGFTTAAELKVAADRYLEVLKETGCLYLLNDNRQLTGPWTEANEWIANDWMPRALAAGLRCFAHVVSPNIFGAMSAKDLETRMEGFSMRLFQDIEDARAWLKAEMRGE